MTITKNASSKLFVAFVAATMLLTLAFAPVAKAATEAELQAQISALLASIASLQTQVGGSSSAPTGQNAYTFTRDLTVGSVGEDVRQLQMFLNNHGTLVALSGTGSAGMESTYFGGLTKAALAKFQASKGIMPSVGYFGPLTRAAVNTQIASETNNPAPTTGLPAGCTSTAGYSSTTGMRCDGTGGGSSSGGSTSGGSLQGGAGDVTVTSRSSGVENEVIEGDEDVQILGFEVEADGSDVDVTSVRVEFEHEGSTGSDQLDRYVDDVSVWMDGDEVGRANADEFSESSDIFSQNIALSHAVVREDETMRFYVAVSAAGNIDSDDLGTDWEVGLGQVRFEDATGAILTDGTGTGVVTGTGNGTVAEDFTFEDLSSSGDVELRVSEDDNSVNDAHSVSVDDSSDTNDVDILSFTLDAQGSDISLNTLRFNVTSNSGTGVKEIANDFRLLMDGDEVGNVAIDSNCDGDVADADDTFASSTDEAICVAVNDLDDDDVMISDGDEVPFTLVADINDTEAGFATGDKLSVTLPGNVVTSGSSGIDADDENGDTLGDSDLSGTADSTNIEFLSTGISVTTVSTNTSVNEKVSTSATDDEGIFEITFDVEAIEDDAYIELGSATRGTAENDDGVNFIIQDQPNAYVATTTGTISLADLTRVSGGSTTGNFVKIGAGQTARFKLAVTFDPGHATGTAVGYRMYLYSVNSAATAIAATAQQVLTPEADYRTGAISVGN